MTVNMEKWYSISQNQKRAEEQEVKEEVLQKSIVERQHIEVLTSKKYTVLVFGNV